MSGLTGMEQELKRLLEEENEIVERMVEIKMEMKRLDSDEKENEIKERKVGLFDLSEKREQCLSKVRELERDMVKWRQEADLEREELRKEQLVKMENTSNLFQERVGTTENEESQPGSTERDKGEYKMNCKAPRYRKNDDFCTFLQRYEQWVLLCGIKDNLDLRLANQIEDDAMFKKMKNIRLSSEERVDVRRLISAVKRELYPATDARIMRTTFHKMKQETLESVEQFAQRIQDTAEKIYPRASERESAGITVLIQGVKDLAIKRRLLQMDTDRDDFDSVIRLAVQKEHISKAVEGNIDSDPMTALEYSAPTYGVGRQGEGVKDENACQKCGKSGHKADSCWSNIVCQLCEGKGHVASVCRSRVSPVEQSSRDASRGESRRPVICYNCQGEGHIQRFCNVNRGRSGGRGGQYRPTETKQYGMQRDHLNWRATGQNHFPVSRN